MQPRIPFLSICSLLLFVSILLSGCGGGGGGASSGGNSLVYTGVSEPARINASNAEVLVTSAFEGGFLSNAGGIKSQTGSTAAKPQGRNALIISKILKETSYLLDEKPGQASSAKAADGAIEGDNSCPEGPGRFEYILSYYADYTAKGIFIYNGYCSRGTRLTGTANVDQLYDSETLMLSSMTISFDNLSIQSGTMYSEAGGSIRYYNILESSYSESINMAVRDRNSSKTYKTENLETFNSIGAGYMNVSVTGGVFYHPDHGFVTMSTSSPLRYLEDDGLPTGGSLQITGSSGSKALLSFYFPDSSCRVQADADGDGLYEIESWSQNWNAASLFSAYIPIITGSTPEAVAIADLNGDGRNDVALVTSFYSDAQNDLRLHVFLQNTYGGLEKAVKYEVLNGTPRTMAAGDLNNDGRADIAVGTDLGIAVFLQNNLGALTLSAFYPTNNAYKLTIGDLNNDGRLDIASIGGGNSTLEIYFQAINGTFSAPVTEAVHLKSVFFSLGGFAAPLTYNVMHTGFDTISTGDINSDGLTDIVVLSGDGIFAGIGVLLQNSAGNFTAPVYYEMADKEVPYGLAIGDVNGDLRDDIVTTYGGNVNRNIGVFLQNGQGGMEAQISYPAYQIPSPVVIADVNNDGREDVVVAHTGWNTLTVYLQESNGELGSYQMYPFPYSSHNPQGLAVGDINSDGRKDVVAVDPNEGLILLYNKY